MEYSRNTRLPKRRQERLFKAVLTQDLKVVVTGGRRFADYALMASTLDYVREVYGIRKIVTGGCPGADWLARKWARKNKIPYFQYEADWKRYGKAAGPIRNREMIVKEKPEVLVAFPGTSGTADCVARATKAGVPIIYPEDCRRDPIQISNEGDLADVLGW